MIEIKLSQGARAGLGGMLSGVRVGDEIAGSAMFPQAGSVLRCRGTPCSMRWKRCSTSWGCRPRRPVCWSRS
ncbi:glutamate synthase-related protein [Streptomyces californicus]